MNATATLIRFVEGNNAYVWFSTKSFGADHGAGARQPIGVTNNSNLHEQAVKRAVDKLMTSRETIPGC